MWEQSKGVTLHLEHECGYVLDAEQREALVPTISRNERDHFLDSFYSLFGPLDHFVRRRRVIGGYRQQPPAADALTDIVACVGCSAIRLDMLTAPNNIEASTRLDSDSIIHGFAESLLAPQVLLRRLH